MDTKIKKVGAGERTFLAQEYANGYVMKPEDVLEYIKIYKKLPSNLVISTKLEFLELLGWKQTGYVLVYKYEKGEDEIFFTAHGDEFYINDEAVNQKDLLSFVGLV